MELLLTVLFTVLLGLLPATLARRKGRNFVHWWIYGSILFVIASIHALLLKPSPAVPQARGYARPPWEKPPGDVPAVPAVGAAQAMGAAQETKLCAGYQHQIPVTASQCPICGAR